MKHLLQTGEISNFSGRERSDLERIVPLEVMVEKHIEVFGKVDTYLVGVDGNAFAVIRHLMRQLQEAGWSKSAQDDVADLMTQGDYNHLIQVAMSVVEDPGKGADEYMALQEARRKHKEVTE